MPLTVEPLARLLIMLCSQAVGKVALPTPGGTDSCTQCLHHDLTVMSVVCIVCVCACVCACWIIAWIFVESLGNLLTVRVCAI